MDETDLLQIKIEKAKAQLSSNTLNAISAVPWQARILKMRETKGYTFEQLGDLEIETELLLCGLLSAENYPAELQSRMRLTKEQTSDLVKEMNEEVFSKIREELVKEAEKKSPAPAPVKEEPPQVSTQTLIKQESPQVVHPDLVKNEKDVLSKAGIEILTSNPLAVPKKETLPVPEKLELTQGSTPHPIVSDKLSGSVQTVSVKTEHSADNLPKPTLPSAPYAKNADPYRLPPV